jgi:uncharacterized protein
MNRILSFAIFFGIFLLVYFAAHFYIYLRLEKAFQLRRMPLLIAIGVLAVSFPVASFLTRANLKAADYFYFVAAAWIGVAFFLLIGFAIVDLLSLAKVDYRIASLVMIILVFLLSTYSIANASFLKVNKVEVKIDGLKTPMKAVQISDVHLGAIHSKSYMNKIVEKTNALNPDIVFITGDLFDGGGDVSEFDISSLKDLKSKYGTYFVLGNHEIYFGADKAVSWVRGNNVTVLRNEVIVVNGVQVMGMDYPGELTTGNFGLKELTSKIDKSKPSILLYHQPAGINEMAKENISLQLSGHLHNGQIFPFGLLQRFFFKYVSGLHKIESSYLYVSQGAGTWGPPMRFLSNSEITEIDLGVK